MPSFEPLAIRLRCDCGFEGNVSIPPQGRVSGACWGVECTRCHQINTVSIICTGDVDPKTGRLGWQVSLHISKFEGTAESIPSA